MNSKFLFLIENDRFYIKLFKNIPNIDESNEKEIQIHLANNLKNHIKISNVALEVNYRYKFQNTYGVEIISDSEINYCKQKGKGKKLSKVDIRVLEPSAWIEIKKNPNKNGVDKDFNNLFSKNGYLFKNDESLFLITFLTKNYKWFEKEYCKPNTSYKYKKFYLKSGNVTIIVIYK